MLVKEAIEKLLKLPQDAVLMKSSSDGCLECNSEGMDYYHEVYDVKFQEIGDYPNEKDKNIVVL